MLSLMTVFKTAAIAKVATWMETKEGANPHEPRLRLAHAAHWASRHRQ